MTLQEEVDFFFAPPLPKQSGLSVSTLHLVRQEMQDCLIGTVVAEDAILTYPGDRHRLFATVMVIMSGIDLLAKFYAGNDEKGGVYARFTAFVAAFMFAGDPSATDYPDVLYYGCRNPLLHSFTFHQHDYRIAVVSWLSPSGGPVRRSEYEPDGFIISVETLVQAFVKMVCAYEAAVRTKVDVQNNFTKMFPTYGSVVVDTRWLAAPSDSPGSLPTLNRALLSRWLANGWRMTKRASKYWPFRRID
jgi:hypothetical protein